MSLRPTGTMKRVRTSASSPAPPSSGRHGIRPRAKDATTTPSSSTIPASPLRSTRAWSRPTTRATSRSSGPAAPQSYPTKHEAPRQGGASPCSGQPQPRPLSDAAGYALARALRAFFIGDWMAAAVVLAAAARTAGLRFSAAADVGVAALRPSPIDFARADRVAA